MAGTRFEDFINFKRFSNHTSFVPLAIYLPFGLLLGVLRLFIFLHVLMLFYILPYRFPLRRFILRFMLTVTGIPISVHGMPKVDSKKLIVSNKVSNLDPFILALLYPNKMVIDDPVIQARQPFIQHFPLPADENHEQILLKLKDSVIDSTEPLLFFPEKSKTNGKVSLLKFSNLPFELDSPIQPVTIQTSRFLFDISVSTFLSNTVEDIFWCLVLPFTLFTVKYLPVTERKLSESRAEFSSRVQSNMARSMGVNNSDYSHHDVIEYSKSRSLRGNEEMETHSNSSGGQSHSPTPSSSQATLSSSVEVSYEPMVEDDEINRMFKQVKEVFPDFHSHGIISDLKETRDVDMTITNILEGKVESSSNKELYSQSSSSSQPMSFKAKKFESNAANRQLSFAERKQAMIEAARIKYKMKHGLI